MIEYDTTWLNILYFNRKENVTAARMNKCRTTGHGNKILKQYKFIIPMLF